jgi:formylglycine-generating enzyme required for sulfatase activity
VSLTTTSEKVTVELRAPEDAHTEVGRRSLVSEENDGDDGWRAPEQFDRMGAVSPATDVWALGLLAFYLLTGREYWLARNNPSRERSQFALMMEVLRESFPPASARAKELRVAQDALPEGFDAWFVRCLQPDPSRRWRDADEACAALLALLGATAVAREKSHRPPAPAPAPVPAPAPTPEVASPAPAPTLPARSAPSPVPVSVPVPIAKKAPKSISSVEGVTLRKRSVVKTLGSLYAAFTVFLVLYAVYAFAWVYRIGAETEARRGRESPALTRNVRPLRRELQSRNPAPSPVLLECPEGMALIEGGTFTPGRRALAPYREPVRVDRFCIDRHEVTVGQFRAFWKRARREPPERVIEYPGGREVRWNGPVSEPERHEEYTRCSWTRREGAHEDLPLNCVDWYTLQAYCVSERVAGTRRGRLPTEAEWEFAARGATRRTFPWGSEAPTGARLNCAPWTEGSAVPGFGDDHVPWLSRAGRFDATRAAVEPSPALFDMAGNVAEWTADSTVRTRLPRALPTQNPISLRGTERAVRGGSFLDNTRPAFTTYEREQLEPTSRFPTTGGRCAFSQ